MPTTHIRQGLNQLKTNRGHIATTIHVPFCPAHLGAPFKLALRVFTLDRAVLAVLRLCLGHFGLGTMPEKSGRAPARFVTCIINGSNGGFTCVALLATGGLDGDIGALFWVDCLADCPFVLALVKSHYTARAQLGTRATCFLANILHFGRDGAATLEGRACEEVVLAKDVIMVQLGQRCLDQYEQFHFLSLSLTISF